MAECAVIGVNDSFKGPTPRGLVVLKAGISADPATLPAGLAQMIRDQIRPVAAQLSGDVVPALQDPLQQDPLQDQAGIR